MINQIKDWGKSLGVLLYPEVCPFCGKTIEYSKEKLCKECSLKLDPIKSPTCLKCGKEVDDQEVDCCDDCRSLTRSYIKGFPAMNYSTEMSECLGSFKYHNMRCYGGFLADLIVRNKGKDILSAAPEVIVPVPIHKTKLKDRGYNQAELLARELGRRLDIPVDNTLILRAVKTTPQKELGNVQREENLKRAFISSKKIVKYKSALVVDDIYTTGATIEACTRALQGMGIKEIYYTSVCVGKGY